eukprot:3594175-Pleurochrysis_carterae.AAC.1
MASIRGPQASGNEDDLTGATLCRSGQAKTRNCALGAGSAAVALASALGGAQEEASAQQALWHAMRPTV